MNREQREIRLRLIHMHQFHNPETGLTEWKLETPQHVKELEADLFKEQMKEGLK